MSARALFAAACCLVLGGSADAGALVQLTWTQSIEGIAVEITGTDTDSDGVTDMGSSSCVDTQPTHVQTTVTCPAGLIGASGSSVGTSYNVSLTMPLFSLRTFTTGGAIAIHTMATFMGSAMIVGGPSAATANQGIPGMITTKVAFHAAKGVNASMQTPGKTTLVKLPLTIGRVYQKTFYPYFLPSVPPYMTVDFYGWIPHSVTFTGLTSRFQPLPTPTLFAMGSVNLSAGGGGVVTLVAPSKISIDGPLAQRRTASVTTLRLVYAPEASALLLLASGAAAFGLARTHGNRKSR